MKKIFILTLALLLILGLTGCVLKIYKLPQEGFCYYAHGGDEIELSQEAQEFIINLLNDGKWYPDIAKCDSDVNFYPKGFKLGYCAESGVINDFTLKRSLTLSEIERLLLNGYLLVE